MKSMQEKLEELKGLNVKYMEIQLENMDKLLRKCFKEIGKYYADLGDSRSQHYINANGYYYAAGNCLQIFSSINIKLLLTFFEHDPVIDAFKRSMTDAEKQLKDIHELENRRISSHTSQHAPSHSAPHQALFSQPSTPSSAAPFRMRDNSAVAESLKIKYKAQYDLYRTLTESGCSLTACIEIIFGTCTDASGQSKNPYAIELLKKIKALPRVETEASFIDLYNTVNQFNFKNDDIFEKFYEACLYIMLEHERQKREVTISPQSPALT